jgi:hypothetical protein
MMDMTLQKTLTALFNMFYYALAKWGCGQLGLDYDPEDMP